jgi:anion transporter
MSPTLRRAAPFAVWIALAVVAAPTGLDARAWAYAGIFAAVLVALALDAFAPIAVGLTAICFAAARGAIDVDPNRSLAWAVSGFGDPAAWSVFGAMVIALGYRRSGLSARLAHQLLRLARRSDGLLLRYAIVALDLVLTPLLPSPLARSGGTIFPVLATLAPAGASAQRRRIGAGAMWTAFASSAITSALTPGFAVTAAALYIARKSAGIDISIASYLTGYAPIALVLLALVPFAAGRVRASAGPADYGAADDDEYPPPQARWARAEIAMAAIAVLAIGLWAVGSWPRAALGVFGPLLLHPATVSLSAVAAMLLVRIISAEDAVADTGAWRAFLIVATLSTLADGLSRVGITRWLAQLATRALTGAPPIDPIFVLLALVAVFYFIRYLFAGRTLHVAMILPLLLAAASGVPHLPLSALALLCAYSFGLASVLTPYASEAGALYYASGLIGRADFWRLGLKFGLLYFAVLVGVGAPWLLLRGP